MLLSLFLTPSTSPVCPQVCPLWGAHVQHLPEAQWSLRGREPRGDAQGIRKEVDSSPAPEWGSPHHSPLQGRLSLLHHRPARLPGNKPPGASCLLGAPGSLGTVSSRSCHHLQAFECVYWGQSSHSVGNRCSYKRAPTAHGTLSGGGLSLHLRFLLCMLSEPQPSEGPWALAAIITVHFQMS